jgi:hypothetical protein
MADLAEARPIVLLRWEAEVLFVAAVERDQLDRAALWAGTLLKSNDHDEPADADA